MSEPPTEFVKTLSHFLDYLEAQTDMNTRYGMAKTAVTTIACVAAVDFERAIDILESDPTYMKVIWKKVQRARDSPEV